MTKHHFEISNSGDEDEEQQQASVRIPWKNSIEDPQRILLTKMKTFDDEKLNRLYEHWLKLDEEIRTFEMKHKIYVKQLDEVESLKIQYRIEFDRYKKKVKYLQTTVNQLKETYSKKDEEEKNNNNNNNRIRSNSLLRNSQSASNLLKKGHLPSNLRSLTSVDSSPALDKLGNVLSPRDRLTLISDHLKANKLNLTRIADTLPRKDPYLKVILGSVDVSILNKTEKWTYKEEYEKFKFTITFISLVSSLIIWLLAKPYRAFDALFQFLLVWYYCTLTIRESILVVNGSNIHPWWRAHHFISTVATGILLTWPESQSYQTFRTQFFIFSFYLSFVQVLQFYYQRGCLYRLRALGETHDMDITIIGFQRWMFRGLSFLVPFLLLAYLFQFYNAYSLWQLTRVSTTTEWQVWVLSMIFFILFLGNILTTWNILREKFREKISPSLLKEKYQNFKAFLAENYHRRTKIPYQRYQSQQNSNDEINQKSKEN